MRDPEQRTSLEPNRCGPTSLSGPATSRWIVAPAYRSGPRGSDQGAQLVAQADLARRWGVSRARVASSLQRRAFRSPSRRSAPASTRSTTSRNATYGAVPASTPGVVAGPKPTFTAAVKEDAATQQKPGPPTPGALRTARSFRLSPPPA